MKTENAATAGRPRENHRRPRDRARPCAPPGDRDPHLPPASAVNRITSPAAAGRHRGTIQSARARPDRSHAPARLGLAVVVVRARARGLVAAGRQRQRGAHVDARRQPDARKRLAHRHRRGQVVQPEQPAPRQEIEAEVVERIAHDLVLRRIHPERDEAGLVHRRLLVATVAAPLRVSVRLVAIRGEHLLGVVLDPQHVVSVQRLAADQVVVAGLELEIEEVRIGNEARLEAAPDGIRGRRLPAIGSAGVAGRGRQCATALGERGGAHPGHGRVRVRLRRRRVHRRQRQVEPHRQVEQFQEPRELLVRRGRRGRRDLHDGAAEHSRHFIPKQPAGLQHHEPVPRPLHGAVEPDRRYAAERFQDPVGHCRDRGMVVAPRPGLFGDGVEQLVVDPGVPQAIDGQLHVVVRRTP